MEACCRYGDVEAGGIELWRRAADLMTWRHGGMEPWGRVIDILEVQRSAAQEARCRYRSRGSMQECSDTEV